MNIFQKFSIGTILLTTITVYTTAQEQATPRLDALQLYRNGRYQQAIQVCRQELQSRNINQRGLRMNSYAVMGWSWLRLGNYREALNTAQTARREVRYDIRIVEIEGEALFYLGRYTDALGRFEEYVSLNDQTTGNRINTVYYFMGEIYTIFKEYHHADIAYSTALFYSPEVAQWWAKLGNVREQIPDIAGAISAYEKALQLNPDISDVQTALERIRQIQQG